MDLLQRLPKAILVTIVALLFFGGTVGVVVAAGEEPLPESFGVIEPREGDRWSYEIKELTETLGSPGDSGEVEFEWLESDIVFDRDGTPRHVQPLFDPKNNITAFVAHDSARVVATSETSEGESQTWGLFTAHLAGEDYSLRRSSTASYNQTYVGYNDEPAPCGFFSDFQGQEVSLDAPITLGGDCAPWRSDIEELEFVPRAMETVSDVPALMLESNLDGWIVRVWYIENFPYPVKMSFRLSSDAIREQFDEADWGKASTSDYELEILAIGYERGNVPWGLPAGVLPAPFGPFHFAPPTITGPQAQGVEHPYPFHVAFENARNDPTYSDLRDFMIANPDAVAVAAAHSLTEDLDRDVDLHSWYYLVADHDSLMAVESTRSIPRDDYAGFDLRPVDEVMREDHGSTTLPPALAANGWQVEYSVPESLPTVQSMQAAYTTTTGLSAISYGFTFLTIDVEGVEIPELYVGRQVIRYEGGTVSTVDASSTELAHHMFGILSDGMLVQESRLAYSQEASGYGVMTDASPLNQQDVNGEQKREVSRAAWALPSPEATAGITFVAFLIGMAYWLWPAAKALPFFGMFSRVRADQMMDNPVRARIMEIIQQQPGIHYQALVREVGKGGSVVDHHLRKLHQGEHIVIQKGPGFTCMFPTGQVDHRIMTAVPALRTEAASKVLKEVLRQPGRSVTDVAQSLGIAKSTASYHVARLRKANLLGVSPKLEPTEDAKRAVAYAA